MVSIMLFKDIYRVHSLLITLNLIWEFMFSLVVSIL